MDDEIALFIKLAEIKNYTKAAKLLNMTTSTLSRRIKSLESFLNLSLIKRNSRSFELTNDGEYIYQNFVSSINEQQVRLADFKESTKLIQGTLRVALPAALACKLITPKICDFNNQYPRVRLIINYTANPVDLILDNYNLALSSSMPNSQNSKIKLIRKLHLKLYASPKYVAKYGMPKELSDIASHRWVGMMGLDGEIYNKYKLFNLKSQVEELFELDFNLYINNALHGIELAKSGEYIVGIFENMIQDEIKKGELIPILEDYVVNELPMYLIRNNRNQTNIESLFIDFLLDCLRD